MSEILVEVEDPIATITLNRPKTDDVLEIIDGVQYAALDRIDAKEGAAALIDKRAASFPRLGE